MPKRDDNLLLEDILESGRKILRYTTGYTLNDFEKDERTIDAVIRNFEIIGEAARNLSTLFIEQNSNIPWREIISYRNLLIHEYFGVSLKAVWNIIQEDLPSLVQNIGQIIGGPQQQQ